MDKETDFKGLRAGALIAPKNAKAPIIFSCFERAKSSEVIASAIVLGGRGGSKRKEIRRSAMAA
jgi:hypothetical protein